MGIASGWCPNAVHHSLFAIRYSPLITMRTLLTRFAHMLFVLWAVATILFFLFRLMPGDPTVAYIDTTFTEEQVAQLRKTFGLDRPLHEQYLIYLKNLLVGEFGNSFHHRRPVIEVLASVLPNTIVLTLTGLLIAYVFGVLVGAWLAWKRGTLDRGRHHPDRADAARRAGVLARHDPARGVQLRARLVSRPAAPTVRARSIRANGRASPRAISSGTSCCRPRRWRSTCRACRCC